MAHRKSRRMPASSAYIGTGNSLSEINKTARKPWQDLPESFRKKTKNHKTLKEEAFTEEERRALQEKLAAEQKIERRRRLMRMALALVLTFVFLAAAVWLLSFYLDY